MPRLSADTLKLGSSVALMGAASLAGWAGLAAVIARDHLEPSPGFWVDVSVMMLGNLLITAIAGLLAWVLAEQPSPPPPRPR